MKIIVTLMPPQLYFPQGFVNCDSNGKLYVKQESSSSSGIFKLLDPPSSSASVAGGLNVANASASNASEQDNKNSNSRKSNLNYRFHFLESDEDDMLSAGSSAAVDRSGGEMCGGGGGDESAHAGADYKFGRYREGANYRRSRIAMLIDRVGIKSQFVAFGKERY